MIRAIVFAAGATVLTVFAWRVLRAIYRVWVLYRDAPHTRVITTTQETLLCENCGHGEVLMEPTSLELADRLRAFKRDHAGCKKKVTHAS